jgi:hypothetical protein
MSKSARITPNAGATIEDDTGDTNMNRETSTVVHQRFVLLQFFGLSGSLGPSQVTCSDMSALAILINIFENFALPKNLRRLF